jgi:hypothetical protein
LRYILSMTLLMSVAHMAAMEVESKAQTASTASGNQDKDDYVILSPTKTRSEAGDDSDDDFVIEELPQKEEASKKREYASTGTNTEAQEQSIITKPIRVNWAALVTRLGEIQTNHSNYTERS